MAQYSPDTRRVLNRARLEARARGRLRMDTLDILRGILACPGTEALAILRSIGVDANILEQELRAAADFPGGWPCDQRVSSSTTASIHPTLHTATSLVAAVTQQVASATRGLPAPLPTGLRDLDAVLEGGLRPGSLTVIAAARSMGKSCLALSIAGRMAGTSHERQRASGTDVDGHSGPIAYLTTDMTPERIGWRLMQQQSEYQLPLFISEVRDGDRDIVASAAAKVSQLNIVVQALTAPLIGHLSLAVERLMHTVTPEVVFLDHLGSIGHPSTDLNQQHHWSRCWAEVKRLVDCFPSVAFVVVCPLLEERMDHTPSVSTVSPPAYPGQSALFHVATTVIVLHRPGFYLLHDEEWQRQHPELIDLAELWVEKNHFGQCRTIRLDWKSEGFVFEDHTPRGERGSNTGAGSDEAPF